MDSATSINVMKEFIERGGYRDLKAAEKKKESVIKGVRNHLKDSELRREEFSRYGLVAKFTQQRDYLWDYEGLNDYLADLGLLIPVAKLLPGEKLKKMGIYNEMEKYELPVTTYTFKPYFNKLGKEANAVDKEEFKVYDSLHLDMLLNIFGAANRELNGCKEEYSEIKEMAMSCPVLKRNKKIDYQYGSMSLIPQKGGYNIIKIVEDRGIDFLISCSKPDMDKLNEFILKGTITQKEVYQFRKDVTQTDKELKFTLMEIESETKQLQMLSSRNLKASKAIDRRKKA